MDAALTATYSHEVDGSWAASRSISDQRPAPRDRSSVTYLAGAAILAAANMQTPALHAQEPADLPAIEAFAEFDDDAQFFVDERALLIEELRQYSGLEMGWDGSADDIAPSREAIEEAIRFVESLPPFIPLPEPMVAGDGEVGLFWHDTLYLDVGFRGRGEVTFFGSSKGEKIKGKQDVDYVDAVPAALLTFFATAQAKDAMQL